MNAIEFIYSDDVTVINKQQFEAHMRLYKGYVDKYNEIEQILHTSPEWDKANATYSKYRGLKRGETYALNGVILHELYFENIGGENNMPSMRMQEQLQNFYSGYNNWRDDFVAAAKASRGWVILAYDQRARTLMNISLDLHDFGNVTLSYPLLVLDMYEHAYFLEYADNKAEYINNFISNINWDVVDCRLEKLF